MAYFLGIDLGTSSVKVILIDENGKVIGKSSENYPLHSPHPGWVEQNPEDWWNATKKALKKLILNSKVESSKIRGVGLSGQTHSTVVLDKNFSPLREAIIWMDQRSYSQVYSLKEKFGDNLYKITGLPLATGFMAPSLLWLKENEPKTWERIYKILLPKDYIRLKLTGEIAGDISDACGTLLLDTTKRKWSKEILEKLGISENQLPSLYESCEISGYVSKEGAEETALGRGTPVFAGGADQVMGAVGNGIVEEGIGSSILGTGGQFLTCINSPKIYPQGGLHTIPHALKGKWILMGAILSGGICFDWFFRKILKKEISSSPDLYEALFKEASHIPPCSEGLLFLPYLKGERTPHLDPRARGAFIGLSLSHSRGHLTRAIIEGIVYALRDTKERFEELGINLSYIVSSGKVGESYLCRKIQADIFNLLVVTLNVKEQSAYGAALVASVGSGVFSGLKEACQRCLRIIERVEPSFANVEIYDQYYEIYRSLYPRLKDAFHSLSQAGSRNF